MSVGFSRLSIFCRDIEASLAFYRDVLGLVTVEDKTIEGPAAGGLLQLPPCRLRIVLLAPAADADVVVGLFQLSEVALSRVELPVGRVAYGQTALVLSTNEFDALHARMEAAAVKFLTPPLRYPKRHASERSPAGLYREMIAYDPDGLLVSIMQIDPLPEQA
jgi:catechol 2,3-dioxygenase-like lactoylglutathione lyase family enzyme